MSQPPWYAPASGASVPAPEHPVKALAKNPYAQMITAIVAGLGLLYQQGYLSKPAAPAPLKQCGKCGSPDCGCQAPTPPAKKTDLPNEVSDPFAPVNAEPPKPEAKKPAHVVDEAGRWWAVADADDTDQRSWYSTNSGKTWFRDGKQPLVAVVPQTCRCPATGNKDGSKGPNNCLCHDMNLDCKCHPNAGIVYTQAPAKPAAIYVPPIPPGMLPVMPMKQMPMRQGFFAVGARSGAKC